MRPLAAHCYLGPGALYQKIGRHDQAQARLTVAAEMYRAIEMTVSVQFPYLMARPRAC
jgi:hypothetical protein